MSSKMATLMPCFIVVPPYDRDGGGGGVFLLNNHYYAAYSIAPCRDVQRCLCRWPSRKPVSRYLCRQRFAARPPVVSPRLSRPSPAAAKKLLALWFAPYGAPELLVVDQGGEFEGAFIGLCAEYSIDTRVAGAHAPWQHGLAERHGGILGTIFNKMVTQFGTEGRERVKLVLNVCTQAKNATMTRNGMTPEQAVFGRALRWPCAAGTSDEDEIPLGALGTDGEAWLAAQIRAAARMALLSRDASDKIRRATLRRAPGVVGELTPGTRVYFWSPHPIKGRHRQDALRWRGPATVIARERFGRYYLGWRFRVLLVAKDQIGLATMEEAAASHSIARDMAMTDIGQRFYKEMTGAASPVRTQEDVPQGPALPAPGSLPDGVHALQDVASSSSVVAQRELDQVRSAMEESEEMIPELLRVSA